MLYTLQNDRLTVTVRDKGAELFGITDNAGTQYLWQGDPAYWPDRAINLFPFVGRVFEQVYTHEGRTFRAGTHGFLRNETLTAKQTDRTEISFSLADNERTRAQYPFAFRLTVDYRLVGSTLAVSYTVENTDPHTLIFGIGGHPGFNVPPGGEGRFEDWYLQFENLTGAKQILFSPTALLTDEAPPFAAKNDRLPLRHALFDNDAIVLKNAGAAVTLASDASKKSIRVTYPDFPYIGFWHTNKTDAPFVCIEPWASLPGRQGVTEDLSSKPEMTHLAPGKTKTFAFTVEIGF
ncbi:MAG: aldose 1-epimerase family protein [Clostridiales bacterium]|jgi:galactose mutarotase-like enzyme|nr:aldose 1-epimerase family protein [Clostridiales bacterium]